MDFESYCARYPVATLSIGIDTLSVLRTEGK
jgi:hypothetical protein